MNQHQIDRESLETLALNCCSAEVYYELMDEIEHMDDASLWIFIEEGESTELSPYQLGRLACRQGVNDVQLDPLMVDRLQSITPEKQGMNGLVSQWFEGWSSEFATMSD